MEAEMKVNKHHQLLDVSWTRQFNYVVVYPGGMLINTIRKLQTPLFIMCLEWRVRLNESPLV